MSHRAPTTRPPISTRWAPTPGLLAMVVLDRQHVTDCPDCGWTGTSATPAGAVVLEEHHRSHCSRLGHA